MKKIATALTLAAAAAASQAAVVSFAFGSPTLPLQTTEISQSGSLALFNSSLGTLTDVSITLYGASTTLITLTNNAAQTQRTNAISTVELSFSSSLAALDAAIADPTFSLTAPTGSQLLNVGQTITVGPLSRADSLTLNAELDAFIASFAVAGGGSFTIGCESLSGLNVLGGGGNIASSQSTQAGCGASITYTFNEAPPPPGVPEPASLALVGLALAAAGAAGRRRKA